jgi:YHS domain-containing protein
MFVDVEFETKAPAGISVPADAVLDSGMRKIVYVETSDGVFEPRPVEISGIFGDQAIVADGIREGERVVISGNFLLDSESRMRASSNAPDAPKVKPISEALGKFGRPGGAGSGQVRDPVCGMSLKPAEIAFQENYQGKTFSFCSDTCRKKFLADPGKYAQASGAAATGSTP